MLFLEEKDESNQNASGGKIQGTPAQLLNNQAHWLILKSLLILKKEL
jgi:hypothetical protein